MKSLLAVIIVVTLIFSFTSCKKEKPSRIITTVNTSESATPDNITTTKTKEITQENKQSSKENKPSTNEPTKNVQSNKTTQSAPTTENQTKQNSNSNDYGTYVTAEPIDPKENPKHKRTGIIAFSDSANNKYIKLISEKYDVPTYLLAAIFTIPYEGMEEEADGNMVLRFDGSKDDKGKLIRTKDTLKTIYMIDANGKCKRLSVDSSESSDFNALEKRAILYAVKDEIMPKFQKELY